MEERLQIYLHFESVAFIVDHPGLFNELATKFNSYATLKFVVLLWGAKSEHMILQDCYIQVDQLGIQIFLYHSLLYGVLRIQENIAISVGCCI